MSIHAADSSNFSMDAKSYDAGQKALHRKMSAIRRMKQGLADEATLPDAAASMDKIREEEAGKDD